MHEEKAENSILTNPVFIGLLFFLISLSFRCVDIFILRMDQTLWGILPSKVIPLVLIILYLRYRKRTVAELGIHSNQLAANVILALLAVLIFNGMQTGGPLLYLMLTGSQIEASIYKMDYIVYDLVFHVTNAFMEEVLFRGIILRCFMTRVSPLKANILQSFLFGLWHVVWPITDFLRGYINADYAIGWALEYILTSGTIGFLWGFIFLKTSSLISQIMMHFSVNMVSIYIMIEGIPSIPGLVVLMIGLFSLVATFIMVYFYTKKAGMPQLVPWDKNLLGEQEIVGPSSLEGAT
jgi:membrane protease YdiL (CAAX protease family)